jgi:hypothetical protein
MQKEWKEYSATRFQALTSLRKSEFEIILSEFQPIVELYFRYHTFSGGRRKCPMFKEYRNSSLSRADGKLFFILYYMKNNSLQESMGEFFGISQGKVSIWARVLLPLLHETMGSLGFVPHNNSEKLHKQLESTVETIICHDATVREVERSTDYSTQKEFYDGKHKCHTIKNHVVCDEHNKILYVSPLYEGKIHDKKLIEEENLTFPENITLLQDTGYQGFTPDATVFMPKKKPKGGELSAVDKEANQMISSIRVRIEHVIGSVKILRMVKEKIRLKKWEIKQTVFMIASAIHNLRKKYRSLINHS